LFINKLAFSGSGVEGSNPLSPTNLLRAFISITYNRIHRVLLNFSQYGHSANFRFGKPTGINTPVKKVVGSVAQVGNQDDR
jgi:hypothetical protein